MQIDSALNLQAEIFRRVFDFDAVGEVSISTGPESQQSIPQFFHKKALDRDADTLLEDLEDPLTRFAIGIQTDQGQDTPSKTNGKANDKAAVVIFLQDRRQRQHKALDAARAMAKDELQVVYTGPIRKQATPWVKQKQRPLRLGSSLGHFRISAGTLGCFVKKRSDGQLCILSNNHVLANVNNGRIGDRIVQPGRNDGGRVATHTIATLEDFIELGFSAREVNAMDAAIARVEDVDIEANQLYRDATTADTLTDTQPIDLFNTDVVQKVGRTTGYRQGVVQAIGVNNLNVSMNSRGRTRLARFDGQIAISGLKDKGRFSKPGDSGSLILTEDKAPAALLFAGSNQGGLNNAGVTFASPIASVLDALDVDVYFGA